jgi:hypothetical protein
MLGGGAFGIDMGVPVGLAAWANALMAKHANASRQKILKCFILVLLFSHL